MKTDKRALLKSMVVGGAIASQTSWVKPVVNGVILPSHAITSLAAFTGTSGDIAFLEPLNTETLLSKSDSMMESALGLLAPAALAQEEIEEKPKPNLCDVIWDAYAENLGGDEWNVAIRRTNYGYNIKGEGCCATSSWVWDTDIIVDGDGSGGDGLGSSDNCGAPPRGTAFYLTQANTSAPEVEIYRFNGHPIKSVTLILGPGGEKPETNCTCVVD